MQITISSSNIIFYKNVGDFLTREEILEQAGISINDDSTLVNLKTAIVLGGGAFDGQGYQITAPLRNAQIEWDIILPDKQKISGSQFPLTLQVVTDQAEYQELINKKLPQNDKPTKDKLEVVDSKIFTLGKTKTVKPLPIAQFKINNNYDIKTAQLIVYPVIGNGKSVNKNLVDFGNTIVDCQKGLLIWEPKTDDVYPFGPEPDDITSLVYAIEAKKYLPKVNPKVEQSSWGFNPTDFITDNPEKIASADEKDDTTIKKPPQNDNQVMDNIAENDNESTVNSEKSEVNTEKDNNADLSFSAGDKEPVQNSKPQTNQSESFGFKPKKEESNKVQRDEAVSKERVAKIEWYQQPINQLKTSAKEFVSKTKASVAKSKKVQKTPKANPKKVTANKEKTHSGKGIITFIVAVILFTTIGGGGIYLSREQSLKPYQAQIATIEQNQNETNSLLDRKTVTTNDLEKAVKLLTTNANLIKQMPTNDNNQWRAMKYNQLEHTHQVLLSKAKDKAKNIN